VCLSYTPNVTANVCLFVRVSSSSNALILGVVTVATLVTRNANETTVAHMVGSEVRRSVLCWCAWQELDFSRRENVHTLNLLHKCCTYNTICKTNAAINCTAVQRNNGSCAYTLAGHTTQLLAQLNSNHCHKLLANKSCLLGCDAPTWCRNSEHHRR
jgi:hypothetical protein